MIYRQIGYKTNALKPINTNETPLETIANTFVQTINCDEDIRSYKANNMPCFISGDITPNEDGSYTRNDNNLKSRDLIIVDIENTGLTSQEVQTIIQEKLSSYKHLLYSTISHKPNNPRLRLVIEPNREILKEEYKPTIQHVMGLLQLNYDSSSATWSQLQGLPIAVRDNESICIKHLDGLKYPVQKAHQKIINSYQNKPIQPLSHNEAISIMKNYLEKEQDKLQERNEYYLSCLTVIAKSVVSEEIEYDTAIECMELLALNNYDWKVNNQNELNNEITRANGNVEYFKNKYTFLEKFQRTQQHSTLELARDENGKVIQSLENIEKIILSITSIVYNELTEVIEIKDNQGRFKQLEKRDKELLRMDIEKKFSLKVKIVDLDTAIVSASDKHRYHPIKKQILAVNWDGKPRAESFFIDVLGVEDNIYNRECTRKWLLASITRIFKPGAKFDEMIILQGGQGIGKSTTLQRLSLGYYTDITEKISDEVIFKVLRTWLVEFSELSTMFKTDSDTYKAWLSAKQDTVRKKYGTDPNTYPRAFTVLGTTNNKEILKDRTGNRRYWIMYCDKEKIKNTIWNIDNCYILQLWSEVYQWYLNKEDLLISEETALHMAKISTGALEYDPLEERIINILEMSVPHNWKDCISNPNTRFKYYNHVNDFILYGIESNEFPLQTKIQDITTGELHYLLGEGANFNTNLQGNMIAKEINKVMDNIPNWEKKQNIKRSYKKGYSKGFKRLY